MDAGGETSVLRCMACLCVCWLAGNRSRSALEGVVQQQATKQRRDEGRHQGPAVAAAVAAPARPLPAPGPPAHLGLGSPVDVCAVACTRRACRPLLRACTRCVAGLVVKAHCMVAKRTADNLRQSADIC